MFTFVESSAFERACSAYLEDEEYAQLQQFMIQNPQSGHVVPGSGGVRKLRWMRPGMGKRGGLPVIYFVRLCAKRILDAVGLRQGEVRQRAGAHPQAIVGGIS